jgi:hypothetical protein
MCQSIVTSIMSGIARIRVLLVDRSQRIFPGFSIEFLLAIAIAIIFGVFPMTGGFKLFFLIVLAVVLAALAWRSPLPRRCKLFASLLAAVATILMGHAPVEDQFNTDAVFRDYKTTRDLVAKFQAHDYSLKRIVEQYDRLNRAQSMFDSMRAKPDENQHAEINRQSIEDLKSALSNFEAIATPTGRGLRIKLGHNMYRVIYPVPMRISPSLSFIGLPAGVTGTIIEPSNLGFTVLFLPLSTPVEHFGLTASAEL